MAAVVDGLRRMFFLKKKWLVNISGRRLQDNKISLLRKGLNFDITLHTVLASEADAICTFLEKIRTQLERNFTEL